MSARALSCLVALGLAACAGGPHGPDQLELVTVVDPSEDPVTPALRVEGQVDLPAGTWEVWLPLPSERPAQRVESLMVQVGPGRSAAFEQLDAGDGRILYVRGRGPLRVTWRGLVCAEPVGHPLPAAAAGVEPQASPADWAQALRAAGQEARVTRGLELRDGRAAPSVWVEVRTGEVWLPLDPIGRGLRSLDGRVALGQEPGRALRDGAPVELDVVYQLSRLE